MIEHVAIGVAVIHDGHIQGVAEELAREHGPQLARPDAIGPVDKEFWSIAAVRRRLRMIAVLLPQLTKKPQNLIVPFSPLLESS